MTDVLQVAVLVAPVLALVIAFSPAKMDVSVLVKVHAIILVPEVANETVIIVK